MYNPLDTLPVLTQAKGHSTRDDWKFLPLKSFDYVDLVHITCSRMEPPGERAPWVMMATPDLSGFIYDLQRLPCEIASWRVDKSWWNFCICDLTLWTEYPLEIVTRTERQLHRNPNQSYLGTGELAPDKRHVFR
ncbi:hypothetical protein PSTG_17477 [Puccinia striiformis f. sp. tritici PST-78]|uniref:Uncharacterized protein n=1 Tax=Puccinia striiformis f. sp. tritici PST-78 TaxID=1165861 RepID=A0A0L0UQN3_9BASI|nr:hypothetical protein PSTG_17477 [Puccinia striiformis f. sp. tritici PST-78]